MKYAALRIYDYTGIQVQDRTTNGNFEVQGQKLTDYNWETIKGFDTKEDAVKFAKEYRGDKQMTIFDTNGYGIKKTAYEKLGLTTYMNRENYLKALDSIEEINQELSYLRSRLKEEKEALTKAVLELKLEDVLQLKLKYE